MVKFRTPRKKILTELLEEHADTLIHEGEDTAPQLLEQHPDAAPELKGLFGLVHRISTTLVPVEPSKEFVLDLKTKLAGMQAEHAESRATWAKRRNRVVKASRVLATVVSVLAAAALLAQIIGSIAVLIAFIVGRRRKMTAQV